MQFIPLLLQDTGGQQESPFPFTMLFFVGILVIFYFFMIRPQTKRQKEEKAFRDALAKGDKVMTLGGIYGKVTSVEDASVLIQIDDNTKIRVDKTALRPVPGTAEEKK
jgi:preprotein translocase subunit YajC